LCWSTDLRVRAELALAQNKDAKVNELGV
jgi:hypothetical protein